MKTKYNVGFQFSLLLFVVFCVPNFKFNGLVFNLYDLLIPICFILKYMFNGIKINSCNKKILIFTIFAFFSLIVNQKITGDYQVSPFLKLYRITYLALVPLSFDYSYEFVFDKKMMAYVCKLLFINCIFGLLIFHFQVEWFGITEKFMFNGRYLFRNGGIFGEANSYSVFLVLTCIYLVPLLINFDKQNAISKIFQIVTFGLALLNILYTDSRTGMVCFLIGMAVIILFSKKSIYEKLIFLISSVAVLLTLYLLIPSFNNFIDNRILKYVGNVKELSSGRIDLWKNEWNNWNKNIKNVLIGYGFRMNYIMDGQNMPNGITDNIYLNILFSTGIIGFFLITLWYLDLFKRVLKSKDNYKMAFLIIFMVAGLFLDILTSTKILIFISILCNNKKVFNDENSIDLYSNV